MSCVTVRECGGLASTPRSGPWPCRYPGDRPSSILMGEGGREGGEEGRERGGEEGRGGR